MKTILASAFLAAVIVIALLGCIGFVMAMFPVQIDVNALTFAAPL